MYSLCFRSEANIGSCRLIFLLLNVTVTLSMWNIAGSGLWPAITASILQKCRHYWTNVLQKIRLLLTLHKTNCKSDNSLFCFANVNVKYQLSSLFTKIIEHVFSYYVWVVIMSYRSCNTHICFYTKREYSSFLWVSYVCFKLHVS